MERLAADDPLPHNLLVGDVGAEGVALRVGDIAAAFFGGLVGSSKLFGSIVANSSEEMLSIAVGLFIALGDGVRSPSLVKDFEVTVPLVQKRVDIIQGFRSRVRRYQIVLNCGRR